MTAIQHQHIGARNIAFGLSCLATLAYLATLSIYRGKQFIFMQDTFLSLSPSFLHTTSWYAWKQVFAPGQPIVSNGYIFYSILSDGLSTVGASPSLIMFFYVTVLIFSSMAAFFYLLHVVAGFGTLRYVLLAVAASFFYCFNMYSLSINWFFFENWTAYAILLPLTAAAVYRVVVVRSSYFIPAMTLTAITQFFLYGVGGPFLVTSLLFAIAYAVLHNGLRRKFVWILKDTLVLAAFLVIPLIPNILVEISMNSIVPQSISIQDLPALMSIESSSTSLLNVLSMSGFIWLQNAAFLYPWYETPLGSILKPVSLMIVGYCFIYSFSYRRETAGRTFFMTIAFVGLLAIFIMKGTQPPLGQVASSLAGLGNTFVPFLIFVNPYYFTGQILVLFVALVASISTSKLLHSQPLFSKKAVPCLFAAVLLLSNLALSATIVYGGMVLPNRSQSGNSYNQVRAFDMPSSFVELSNILQPQDQGSRTILLPSVVPGQGYVDYWQLGDGTIAETSGLLNQLVAMPLVSLDHPTDANTSLIANHALEEAQTGDAMLGNFLSLLGVQYVVYNGYLPLASLSDLNASLANNPSLAVIKSTGNFTTYQNTIASFPELYLSDLPLCIRSNGLVSFMDTAASYMSSSNLTSLPVFLPAESTSTSITENCVSMLGPQSAANFLLDSYIRTNSEAPSIFGITNSSAPIKSDIMPGQDIILHINYTALSSDSWNNLVLESVNKMVFEIQLFRSDRERLSSISIQEYSIGANGEKEHLFGHANLEFPELPSVGNYDMFVLLRDRFIVVKIAYDDSSYIDVYHTANPLEDITTYLSCPNSNVQGILWSYNQSQITESSIPSPSSSQYAWTEVNPTEYKVSISTNVTAVYLVLLETYDSSWSLDSRGTGFTINHFKANGYSNGWLIASDRPISGTFTVRYSLQQIYMFSNYWTIAVFVVSSSGLLFVSLKKLRNNRKIESPVRSFMERRSD